ncbi:MAG TPA: protein kinase [Pyrinomonadaceae bacterium]
MTPERYRKVGEIYHAALGVDADKRAAFLESACAADAELRREVESLINSHEQAEDFIDAPALTVAVELLAAEKPDTLIGQTIARYRVLSLAGVGGMGRVYVAEDTALGRRVALKLLPEYLTHDRNQVQRFHQEARAASALNHPNILTVYEVGEISGAKFIATEYVDGQTLRVRMLLGELDLREAVDIAKQVAAALVAAHAIGIVHRDIKPENVMLRADGYAKVLDFGLAKLTQNLPELSPAAESKTVLKTTPGMVMGTVAYMSPEQARGKEVDGRTDIWSLGVVLYEMLTGSVPFTGETSSDVLAAILKAEPPPLAQYTETPEELQRIAHKCLEKNRAERYQTAKDLLIDLRRLKHRLEVGAEVGRSKKSLPRRGSGVATSGNPVISSRLSTVGLTRNRTLILITLIGILMTAGLVYGLFFFRNPSTPALQSEIKSLAVLPLKSLNREARDDYLGLGIADTIIGKVSQVGELTVRPTSAVRKYADQEMDSLEAARQLQVDSVLDGNFLHAGDKLRVSVNLLRVRDGASLWAESFDMRFTDIFAIQDKVSQEITARLRLKLSTTEQARLAKRHTTNPEAYSYYTKAMYHFSKRVFSGYSQEETDAAIDLLKKAIELDPNYALAHADLGYAYAWIADFKQGGPGLIADAKGELRVAERLDPQLAEVHVARSFIDFTHYEDWQLEAAIQEARMAEQLDPSIPNDMLATLYYHVGLDEQAVKEFQLAMEQDPTSELLKRSSVTRLSLLARPDEWLALNQKLFNRGPDIRYYLEKRMLKEAAPLIEQEYTKHPDEPESRRDKALLLALQGKHREAQAAVPRIVEKLRRDKAYHHFTYDIARIYALADKSEEALKWLRITANEGFPCYTLFARDAFLDPIRKDPAFIQFMVEMKTRWEGYRREFG